jgi:indoleacetamide hydrolase
VKNPYDPHAFRAGKPQRRSPPGSVGSDTAGSVRMPAHFCGIAGLRPSNPKASKSYPVDGIVPLVLALDVPGSLARNVADIALVHTAITRGP